MPRRKRGSKKLGKILYKKPIVSDSVKNYVKKAIAVHSENKVFNYDYGVGGLYFANGASFTTVNVTVLTPNTNSYNIQQGSGQGGRIGNRVRIRKVMMRMLLYPAKYNVVSNNAPIPQDVTLFIFGMKPTADAYNLVQTASTATFLQDGNSSQGLSSTLEDQISEVNKDQVTLFYRKTFKLGYAGVSGTGNQADWQYFINNDYKMKQVLIKDITKYFPKVLEWNDTTATCQSKGLYMILCPCSANGESPIASQIQSQVQLKLEIQYEDA